MEPVNYWQKRIGRRRLLRGAALGGAGLTAAVVIGCGDDDEEASTATSAATATPGASAPAATPTPAAAQPKKGGVWGRDHAPPAVFDQGLYPHTVTTSFSGHSLAFYQTLIRLNPRTFQVEPEIAKSWEIRSPTEIVFKLNENVKFHNKPPANGRLLTAEDVVFNLDKARTNDPKFVNRAALISVDKFEAVDKATVRMTLKQPDAGILANIASFSFGILAPEVIQQFEGNFTSAASAVGTGAFILESVDGKNAKAVRNPDYWKPGMPYLDAVQWLATDEQTAMSAFTAGQLAEVVVPGNVSKKTFDEQQGKDYVAEWFALPALVMTQTNIQKPPFNDPRLPKAIKLLIDHDEAIKGWADVHRGRGHHSAVFPATLTDWDFTQEEYVKNFLEWKSPKDEAIKTALDLLSAAGYTKDKPLKFVYSAFGAPLSFNLALHPLAQNQWKRLGQGVLDPALRLSPDFPTLAGWLAQGDFELLNHYIAVPQGFEPDSWLSTNFHSKGPRNYGKWSDATLDAMIDKQRGTFDTQQRKAIVKDAIKYIIDNAPETVWTAYYELSAARKNAKNWAPGGTSVHWSYSYESVWMS